METKWENQDEGEQYVEEMEGIEIEKDFFSNPYVFDPVISEDVPVAFDVQGSLGKNKSMSQDNIVMRLFISSFYFVLSHMSTCFKKDC